MPRRLARPVLAVGVTSLVLLAACSGSDPTASPPKRTTTTIGGERGWIGGEPDWSDGSTSAPYAERASGGAAEASADMDVATSVTDPMVPGTGPLRAGSVDDNADFAAFLNYLEGLDGVKLRDLDARGRSVVTVVGSDGNPAAGREVIVRQGGSEIGRARTTADGTVRVLPALYGGSTTEPVEVAVGDVSADVEAGGTATLTLAEPAAVQGPVAVDILFLLDATGSMGDEIDQLKATVKTVAERIDGLDGDPDVRFAMTLYRDEGDSFVTANHDFTSDVDGFSDALDDVEAGGGGDYPEAMEEGLADALAVPAWRDPASTVQLVFLVADAPPQIERDVATTYPASVRDAIARGIKVFPVASSESDDQAEAVFRQVAQATGARFVFLSYGAAGAATGEHTDIESTDYQELSLDDLVVRLVSEELDHLALAGGGGATTTVPPQTTSSTAPASTTTTNPPGQ